MIEPFQSDDLFLADVERAPRESPEKLHLWWLGQSGYLLRHRQATLLIDPYLSDSLTTKYLGTAKPHVRMHRRVADPGELGKALGRIDLVTSSHAHTDHLDPETLQPLMHAAKVDAFLLPRAILNVAIERTAQGGKQCAPTFVVMNDGESTEQGQIHISSLPSAHETIDRDEMNRCKYLGYVFGIGGKTIYHSGDTLVYDGLADRVRALGPIDIAILPINGKVGNMGGRDAARLAKEIGAKLVIPCHYDMFEFNTADPEDEFVPECERIGQAYRVLRLGERLTL